MTASTKMVKYGENDGDSHMMEILINDGDGENYVSHTQCVQCMDVNEESHMAYNVGDMIMLIMLRRIMGLLRMMRRPKMLLSIL